MTEYSGSDVQQVFNADSSDAFILRGSTTTLVDEPERIYELMAPVRVREKARNFFETAPLDDVRLVHRGIDMQDLAYHYVAKAMIHLNRTCVLLSGRRALQQPHVFVYAGLADNTSTLLGTHILYHSIYDVMTTRKPKYSVAAIGACYRTVGLQYTRVTSSTQDRLPRAYAMALRMNNDDMCVEVHACFRTGVRVAVPVGLIPQEWLEENASILEAHALMEALA